MAIMVILSSFLMTPLPLRFTLFPTRRSSDLGGRQERDDRGPRLGPRHAGRCRARPARGVLLADGARARRTDRKSTRLNSSHGSISYAVFCLKKKIEREVDHKIRYA